MSKELRELDKIISDGQRSFNFQTPKYVWKCKLIEGTYWYIEDGKQPNAFHRFMQRICFGIKWSRIDES